MLILPSVGKLDPSTVGTTTTTTAPQYPFQRKSLYANGLFWGFYSNGTNLVYYTSPDNVNWTVGASSPIRACTIGFRFSVFVDTSGYLHYAYCLATSNQPILYRRGYLESDGSITWSAVEQTVLAGAAGKYYHVPCISTDSADYPWIGYRWYDGTFDYPYVTKSSTKDGTWTTETPTFPYQLSTSVDTYRVAPIPLTSQRMLVIYTSGYYIRSKQWNGSAFGAERTTDDVYLVANYCFSAVNEGDDVHLALLQDNLAGGYNILHYIHTYATDSWGSPTTVQASVTITSAPVLSIDTINGELYCFWAGSPVIDYIYYKKYSSGAWDTDPTIFIGSKPAYLGPKNVDVTFYGVYWKAQSFKAKHTGPISSVRLYLKRWAGTDPVDIQVSIRNADAEGKPTGDDLAVETIPSFTTDYSWKKCTFASPASGVKDNQYCIVARAPTGTTSNYYVWGAGDPVFEDGTAASSLDSGVTWSAVSGWEFLFEVWMDGPLVDNDRLTCFYKDYNSCIGLVYMTSTTTYNVRFDFISLAVPPPPAARSGLYLHEVLAHIIN